MEDLSVAASHETQPDAASGSCKSETGPSHPLTPSNTSAAKIKTTKTRTTKEPGGQVCNLRKWHHLVAKIETNTNPGGQRLPFKA